MSTSGERTEHSGQLAGLARKAAAAKMPGMLSRRRVITILGAVAGLPILPAGDEPNNVTRLHRWRGTALGSPSYILLHHPDRGAAEQRSPNASPKSNGWRRGSACIAATARSHASIATVVSSPHPMIS
jgi:hypothetical protein